MRQRVRPAAKYWWLSPTRPLSSNRHLKRSVACVCLSCPCACRWRSSARGPRFWNGVMIWWLSGRRWTAAGSTTRWPASGWGELRAFQLFHPAHYNDNDKCGNGAQNFSSKVPEKCQKTRWCRLRCRCILAAAAKVDLGSGPLWAASIGQGSKSASETVRSASTMYPGRCLMPKFAHVAKKVIQWAIIQLLIIHSFSFHTPKSWSNCCSPSDVVVFCTASSLGEYLFSNLSNSRSQIAGTTLPR